MSLSKIYYFDVDQAGNPFDVYIARSDYDEFASYQAPEPTVPESIDFILDMEKMGMVLYSPAQKNIRAVICQEILQGLHDSREVWNAQQNATQPVQSTYVSPPLVPGPDPEPVISTPVAQSEPQEDKCTCDLHTIMSVGCKCSALQRERARKNA